MTAFEMFFNPSFPACEFISDGSPISIIRANSSCIAISAALIVLSRTLQEAQSAYCVFWHFV